MMDFRFTPEEELLRDSARRLLAAECPPGLLRAHIGDRRAVTPLWRHLSDWVGLGRGPLTQLCIVLEETGAVAAPGPFLATTAFYGGLPSEHAGSEVGTVAVAGADGSWLPNEEPTKTFVLDADLVERVAFVVGSPREPAVLTVERKAVALREMATVDPSRRLFEATLPAEEDLPRVEPTRLEPDAWERFLERAWVALAAEQVGAARTILHMAVDYAKVRKQFDRPIGSFQAVQHKCANMALAWEQAEASVFAAAMAIDADAPERRSAAHVAKTMAGEAARLVARDSIQIHGGIGYTWEHDLHLYMRRAIGDRHLLGTPEWHEDRLADLVVGALIP